MMTNESNTASPKIIDFGLAKIICPNEKSRDPFGTLGYVAPEVLMKEPYSFSCDAWSFGCIIYAMLCGALPFDSKNPEEIISMTVKGSLSFDLPCWMHISLSARDLLSKLLAKDPRKRMPMEDALKHPWFTKRSFRLRSMQKQGLLSSRKTNLN
mmetsp:Transcript_31174/g.47702  ORF Transcript_31174/g.47702 Transcript_31174/m.47702 type:complete len:154 (-) Transcript_31174:24-485(-)